MNASKILGIMVEPRRWWYTERGPNHQRKAKLVSGLKVFALVAVSIATFPLVFVVAVLWMVGDMMAEARDREIL